MRSMRSLSKEAPAGLVPVPNILPPQQSTESSLGRSARQCMYRILQYELLSVQG